MLPDRKALMEAAMETAELIATKSPVAVQGTKHNLVYSRDHGVEEGLRYQCAWNAAMLQSEDLVRSAQASMTGKAPTFSKL